MKQDLFKTVLVGEFYNLMPQVDNVGDGDAPTLDALIMAYYEHFVDDLDKADELTQQYINDWIANASRTLARAMGAQS